MSATQSWLIDFACTYWFPVYGFYTGQAWLELAAQACGKIRIDPEAMLGVRCGCVPDGEKTQDAPDHSFPDDDTLALHYSRDAPIPAVPVL